MKRKLFTIVWGLWMLSCSILGMLPVTAQKTKSQSLVTQEQINKINDLVKPLKDQIDKQLNEDGTGMYKAYQEDIRKLNSAGSEKERRSYSKKINEKYAGFFKSVWSTANVDEKLYQQKIKQAFPDAISKQIQFQPFLNFTISYSYAAPPLEPASPDKCIDICSIAAGEINGSSGLISGGGGTYGNCFLRTSGWGAAAGGNNLYGFLRNNITIPGTLPNDGRKLRVKKRYEINQEVTSFAVLGFGYAETDITTYQSREYLFVMSPVIFMAGKINKKTMQEEYVLEKKEVAKSIFKSYAGTFAAFISGNWCFSEISSIKWSICEEK